MSRFAYHDPATVSECLALLATHGSSAMVLAGGQSLLPLLAARAVRVDHLIDLRQVAELRGITVTGDGVRIAAMTSHSAAERDQALMDAVPPLPAAVSLLGPPQVRNRGTIGGALADTRPWAVLPAAAIALGGEIELAATGRRVAAERFFRAARRNAVAGTGGEEPLITALRLPPWPATARFAVEQIVPWGARYPLAGAIGALTETWCRLVVYGVTPAAARVKAAEQALTDDASPAAVASTGARELARLTTAVGARMAEHVLRAVTTRLSS
jgi:aerobic carbon-monoxide dehydrogenase medium subunit